MLSVRLHYHRCDYAEDKIYIWEILFVILEIYNVQLESKFGQNDNGYIIHFTRCLLEIRKRHNRIPKVVFYPFNFETITIYFIDQFKKIIKRYIKVGYN